ncbi:MAG: hypothetical protein LBK91_00220 [Synergistaceae bacterium]|jgi:hypothetical protein|nr:hypothetical protein [Synergistaceae bacterium]
MCDKVLVNDVKAYIDREPRFFSEIVAKYAPDYPYVELLRAWSDIREENILRRDGEGRYSITKG